MPTYVCVKDNVITQVAKSEDPPLVAAVGEEMLIAPPVLPGMPEPEVGWEWNSGNPAPAASTVQSSPETGSDPVAAGRVAAPPPSDAGAPPPSGTPPQPARR